MCLCVYAIRYIQPLYCSTALFPGVCSSHLECPLAAFEGWSAVTRLFSTGPSETPTVPGAALILYRLQTLCVMCCCVGVVFECTYDPSLVGILSVIIINYYIRWAHTIFNWTPKMKYLKRPQKWKLWWCSGRWMAWEMAAARLNPSVSECIQKICLYTR